MGTLPEPATALGYHRDAVLAVPADGQTVYRVLVGDKPDVWDFKSRAERGDDRLPGEPALLWVALSTWDRPDRAWKLVHRGTGRAVAALDLQQEDEVHIARTRRRAGHYSIWGEAAALLERATLLGPDEAATG